MCPALLVEGPFCWFLVLFPCVCQWSMGDANKLLLFGTFCLILYGRRSTDFCSHSGHSICNSAVWFPAFCTSLLNVYGPGLHNPSSGVPGMLFVAPRFWWHAVNLLGLGSYMCTGFLNWVGPDVKLLGSAYQVWSRVYIQAWGYFQGLLLAGRDYVLSDEFVSLGWAYLIFGRVHLGQVCFCVTQSTWGVGVYSIRPSFLFVLLWCMRPTYVVPDKPKKTANSMAAGPYFYCGKLKPNYGSVCYAAQISSLASRPLSRPLWALKIHAWPRFITRCECNLDYLYGVQLWTYDLAHPVLNPGLLVSWCCCFILKAQRRVNLVVRDEAATHAIVLWLNHKDSVRVMLVCNRLDFIVRRWRVDCFLLGKDISPTSLLKGSRCCMFFLCWFLRSPKHVLVTRR
ncbi:hypothetical protein HanRHA438_Chr00c07g0846921 [Helianthus annuus]|nr:hypothetical protein HanRHA438_Chr00c07g0846921 [Helianthus annuus]